VDQILEDLPRDAEITATTWFAVHLYQRDVVYMFPNFYAPPEVTEYLVCKPEEAIADQDGIQKFIEDNHYVLLADVAFLRVYVQPDSAALDGVTWDDAVPDEVDIIYD